ncbi:unnamed protein product [Lactuca virosa]|uniref:Uncharacterized protein n=1 Tax=Lactuca virosa TaxID=75947 RepID=A0AAU9PRS6_9ASTR|nr:unnamed protein product [Lactuca virosa]
MKHTRCTLLLQLIVVAATDGHRTQLPSTNLVQWETEVLNTSCSTKLLNEKSGQECVCTWKTANTRTYGLMKISTLQTSVLNPDNKAYFKSRFRVVSATWSEWYQPLGQMDAIDVDYQYDRNYIEGAKSGRRSFIKQQSKIKLTQATYFTVATN